MKFFELIPPGTNIQFVAKRVRFLLLSLTLVLASFAAMAFNHFDASRASVLNFGIDFVGGSSVRLAMSRDVDINEIRESLASHGHAGSSVVAVPDAQNEYMVRVKEVVSITPDQAQTCRAALEKLDGVVLAPEGFEHPEGGSKIFMRFAETPPLFSVIDSTMAKAGCAGQSAAGSHAKEDIHAVDFALIGIAARLVEEFNETLGADTVSGIVSSETVGAKAGAQLKVKGVEALLYAMGFIFLFVMIRFDLRFAPGGIVALIHDSIIVVGVFAITWKEFNLQTIAAILTIIGYSINDTIVVFDRVRERVALHRDDPIEETTNRALNDTLSRTVLTSGTTLLVLGSILVLGSGTIRDFAFALTVGVIVGTYSSLFVASPTFLWINNRFYGGTSHLAEDEDTDDQPGGSGGAQPVAGIDTGDVLGGSSVAVSGEPESSGPSSAGSTSGAAAGERKASRRRRRKRD